MDLQNGHYDNLFSHEKLKLGGNSIRLITLLPGSDHALISCQITQYAIHRRPGYIALSYQWGSETEPYYILLNGKKFGIRKNLFDCLRQLRRHHHQPLTLWIDALCIDQTDVAERNHIVQLMDQVYERADTVFIWLGEGSLESDRAMRFLSNPQTIEKFKKHSVKADPTESDFPVGHTRDWVAVFKLFEKPYWTRLWIIQETLLAPSLHVFCGRHRILWKQIEDFVLIIWDSLKIYEGGARGTFDSEQSKDRWEWLSSWLDKRSETHCSVFYGHLINTIAARMVLRRSLSAQFSLERSSYPSLQALLETFKDSQCFDSRDEIFGLLSIAGDFHDKRIDYIDYNLSSTQVLVRFLDHYADHSDEHEKSEPLFNIRRLSDALRVDIYDLLYRRESDFEARKAFTDLAANIHYSGTIMRCHILYQLSEEEEKEEDAEEYPPSCVLKSTPDLFSPDEVQDVPFGSTWHFDAKSDFLDNLAKLNRLERRRGNLICNAVTYDATSSNENDQPFPLKYFVRTNRTSDDQMSYTFGIVCDDAKPGDLLVKSKESDLLFVARLCDEDGTYKVIGTAAEHQENTIVTQGLLSSESSPTSSHPPQHHRTISSSTTATTTTSNDPEIARVRFNPLMLLMIVNEPNWRKDKIDSKKRHIERRPTSYTAIQPRKGSQDATLKAFDTTITTGSEHLDRAANRLYDRTNDTWDGIKEVRDGLRRLFWPGRYYD